MERLDPNKLQVTHSPEIDVTELTFPRRYTLTHSDFTGELYLSIGRDYNMKQVSGLYTRFMRDEVFAEFADRERACEFSVHCHASGGFVFGTAGMRYNIFKREMRLVLEAFRYGDRKLFEINPDADSSTIMVYFHSPNHRYNVTENFGKLSDYR